MSLSFYQLRDQPFGDTPDPRFLFKSEAHSRTLAALLRHTLNGERLQTVIAPPGTGKTTLLFALLEELHNHTQTAFLSNTLVNSTEFIGFLLRAVGISDVNRDAAERRTLLNQHLAQQANAKQRVVAIIDEAQNLETPVLREVRTLVEHAPQSLQIILAGQTQLKDNLRERSVSVLLSAIPHELRPLDAKETGAYIHHRLNVAGYNGPEIFSIDAIRAIARESEGVPRSINMICFQSMLQGALMQQPHIDRDVVLEAVRRFGFNLFGEEPKPVKPPANPKVPSLPKGSIVMKSTPTRELRKEKDQEVDVTPAVTPSTRRDPSAEPTPVPPLDHAPRSAPATEFTAFAAALRKWLERSAPSWTGTVSELVQIVASVDDREFQRISALSAKDLLAFVERSSDALRQTGIDVEIRNRPGSPRLISLRLNDGGRGDERPPAPTPPDLRKLPDAEARSDTPTSKDVAGHGNEGKEVASIGVSETVALADAPEGSLLVATLEPPPEEAQSKAAEPAREPAPAPDLPGLSIATDDSHEEPIEVERPPFWERVDRLYVTVGIGVLLVFAVLMLYARHATTHAAAINTRAVSTSLPPADAATITRLKHDADAADPDAQYALGLRYASGNGVPRNEDEGLKLLRRAAEQGHAEAQFELGNLLSRDNVVSGYPWLVLANEAGVERSREVLANLTPKLSASDIAAIRFELGQMFSNGVGVARDYVAAYTWFQLAQAAGDQRAVTQKAELRGRMRTDEVAEASKRADDWLQQHSR